MQAFKLYQQNSFTLLHPKFNNAQNKLEEMN